MIDLYLINTGGIASKLGLVASFFASNNQVFLKIEIGLKNGMSGYNMDGPFDV